MRVDTTPTVVLNNSPVLPLNRTALWVLSHRIAMARLMLALMLYFLIIANKASCHTLSKVFLKSMKTCSNGNVFSPTEFGTSRTLVVPALVSDGERGRCAWPRPIRYGYSVIRCCHWWCVLGISLVRRCPLLSKLQV